MMREISDPDSDNSISADEENISETTRLMAEDGSCSSSTSPSSVAATATAAAEADAQNPASAVTTLATADATSTDIPQASDAKVQIMVYLGL